MPGPQWGWAGGAWTPESEEVQRCLTSEGGRGSGTPQGPRSLGRVEMRVGEKGTEPKVRRGGEAERALVSPGQRRRRKEKEDSKGGGES